MTKSLSYSDIHLIPNYSDLKTRADANTSVTLGKFEFKLPVVPSNMASCISFEKACWLAKNGYFYILHRFYDYEEILEWIVTSQDLPFVSISIGIKERDVDLVHKIIENKIRLDFVTVDVAHGDHKEAMDMLKFLKVVRHTALPNLFVIGGNIATTGALIRMTPYVDAVKVGIACGASCITYDKTGFASPMFSTVRDIAFTRGEMFFLPPCEPPPSDRIPLIIADGGINSNGDIAKALVAGADLVMAGSMFARCIDSPAMVDPTNPTKKLYFGSASSMNGNKKNIEGKTISMPMNGMTYAQKLQELRQDLTSAISYAGGSNLQAFKDVDWALI